MTKPPKSDNDNRDFFYEVFGIRSKPPIVDEELAEAIRRYEKVPKFNERMKNPFFRKRVLRLLNQREPVTFDHEPTHEEMRERMREHSKRVREKLAMRKSSKDDESE